MNKGNERGEGKLSGFIWLAALFAFGYVLFNVGPVYYANYSLADKMTEIAKLPRGLNTDAKLLDMLMKQGVGEYGLGQYVQRDSFKITSYEGGRSITCIYDREADVLPGWKKIFHFENKVDAPLIY
jgi:hypothetical protein